MFLLYHSEGYNADGTVFHWCYINDYSVLHHAVVCWVTAVGIRAYALTLGWKPSKWVEPVGWIVTIGSHLIYTMFPCTSNRYSLKNNLVTPTTRKMAIGN